MQVGFEPGEPQLAVAGEQALLRLEKHAEAGAGNVVETAAVEGHGAIDTVEERLRPGRFRGIQTPGDHHRAVCRTLNPEHRCLPCRSRLRAPRPWRRATP